MGSGANPGGFLSGLWGVVGPDIEKKHDQKIKLQGEEKQAEIAIHRNAMEQASYKLYGPGKDKLSPEEAASLSQQFKFSKAQLDKTLGKDKEFGPKWQKFSGAITKLITAPNSRKQKLGGPQTQAPQQQQQSGAAPGGGAPGGQQLPGPQTPPPEQAEMQELAMAAQADPQLRRAEMDRARRAQEVQEQGQDWTSREKLDWIENGKLPIARVNTSAQKYDEQVQAAIDSEAFGDPDDPETAKRARTAVGRAIFEKQKRDAGPKTKMTGGWAKYPGDPEDAEPHAIVEDVNNPGHMKDADSGEPVPQGAKKINPTIFSNKMKMNTYGAYGNYYRAAMGRPNMTDTKAREIAGDMVFKEYGVRLAKAEQQYALDQKLSFGVGGEDYPTPQTQSQEPPPQQPTSSGGGPGAAGPSPTPAPGAQPAQGARPPAGAGGQGPAPAGPARPFEDLSGANAPQEMQPQSPAQFAPVIKKAAAENGIDEGLLTALLRNESNFDPNAVSPKGAQGIAQFMPGTAKQQGVGNANNPQEAIPAAAKYLAQLRDQFKGNMQLAVAAYNAGPAAVQKAGGDISKLPKETQDYVSRIMKDRASGNQQAGGRQVNVAPTFGADPNAPANPSDIASNEVGPVNAYLSSLFGNKSGAGGKAAQVGQQAGMLVLARVTGMSPVDFQTAAVVAKDKVKAMADTIERYGSMIRITNAMDAITPSLLEGAQNAINTGSPWATKRLRDIEINTVGDPATREYLVTLNDFVRHYSTVTAGGTMSRAMLPVTVAAEADKLLDPNMTVAETIGVVQRIRQNSEIEKQASKDTITDLKNEVRGFGKPPGTPETTRVKPKAGQTPADNKAAADAWWQKNYGNK